jgi:nitroreductase
MEFDELIQKRHSVRSFKGKAVSWKPILEAIDATLKGPFAGNQNNLTFLIVEDAKLIEQIAKNCQQTFINESKLLIVVCTDDHNLENMYGERGKKYSRQQAGAAIQTLIFKLIDLGIDSCWIGAYSDELIKDLLAVPQHINIEAIIPTGYEKTYRGIEKEKARKKELSQVLFWDKWGQFRRPIFKEETSAFAGRAI